jgi:UDP-2,3-diacylglucosamine hydrolase
MQDTLNIKLVNSKKIYFASDFHLGTKASAQRERSIVSWMNSIKSDCSHLFLMGDVFDYWFEYRNVVPKYHTRLLGKLAEFTDSGIEVYLFTGNHDMWLFNYFQEELGIHLFKKPLVASIGKKRFFLGHGDGLGPGDHAYKLVKSIFANPFFQWLYARIHPDTGIAIMKYFSLRSRISGEHKIYPQEWLIEFVEEYSSKDHIDFYIFGHRHLPIEYTLRNKKSVYYNLGDWIDYRSFGVYDGNEFFMSFFENETGIIENFESYKTI